MNSAPDWSSCWANTATFVPTRDGCLDPAENGDMSAGTVITFAVPSVHSGG